MNENPNDVLTTEEVAAILRCSKDTVRKLADSKRLRSVSLTTGGKKELPRFLRKNVMAFLDGDDNQAFLATSTKTTAKPKRESIRHHSIMGIEP